MRSASTEYQYVASAFGLDEYQTSDKFVVEWVVERTLGERILVGLVV